MLYKRILLPIDGSPLSMFAARAGIEFAQAIDAQVIGLYVAPEFRYLMYSDMFPLNEMQEKDYKAAESKAGESYLQEIQDVANDVKVNFSSKVVFSNSVSQEIVDIATREDCDLIFMGSHGRGGAAQLILGSVTSKVLSTCAIPVLVYRENKPS